MAEEIKIAENVYDQQLSSREVEERLSKLLASPGGIQKVAQQMLSPLKRDLLFEGRARQIFQTYKLALGEEAVFDADLDVPAVAISVEGLPYKAEVKSSRVRIDTAPLAERILVRWNESNFRKFDILNRTQERAKAALQFKEDQKAYLLLKYATTQTVPGTFDIGNQGSSYPFTDMDQTDPLNVNSNNATLLAPGVAALQITDIAQAIVSLRAKLLVASKVYINPQRGQDIMMFNTKTGAATGGYGIFAPNFQENLLKAGRIGNIFGCEIIESVVVPAKEVYVLAPADYLGVIAVRTDLSVETMKDVNQMGDIFAIWEDLGFLARWVKGIVRIQLT